VVSSGFVPPPSRIRYETPALSRRQISGPCRWRAPRLDRGLASNAGAPWRTCFTSMPFPRTFPRSPLEPTNGLVKPSSPPMGAT
jgi:hypothetical protein